MYSKYTKCKEKGIKTHNLHKMLKQQTTTAREGKGKNERDTNQ